MSASPSTRRAIAEIDFGEGQAALFKIGNRSIHQFWHLFSAHFRHVLLAPQRRPDSDRVAWNWREAMDKPPITATELAEVRRRLTEANLSLEGGFGGMSRDDDVPGGGATLEGQVRANVREMVAQLIAMRDFTLATYVCRTDGGLMLHSWGAANAAQPHFPDAQNGEISGRLFGGTEQPAGASIVLENETGGNVARISSDKEGGFRFLNIPPGTYRVRVADRSDFPPQGLLVTMERESITGLELRRDSVEPISIVTSPTPAADNGVPWYRRTVAVCFLALLFLAAAGAGLWHMQRDKNTLLAAKNNSADWQAASGQAGGADPKSTAIDERKVGSDGAWSSLSKSIPDPKISLPLRSVSSSEVNGEARDNAGHVPSDSTPTQFEPRETKDQTGDTADKSKLADQPALAPKSDRPSASLIDAGQERLPLGETSSLAQEGDASKPAENKPASMLKETAEKKKRGILGGGLQSEDIPAAPDALSTELDPSSSAGNSEEANGESSSTRKPSAQLKKPSLAGSSGQSSRPAPEKGSSALVDSNSAGPATDQIKANSREKSKEKSVSGTSSEDSSRSPESLATKAKTDTAIELPLADLASEKNGTKPTASKKEAAEPKAAKPEPEPESKNKSSEDDSAGQMVEQAEPPPVRKNSPAALSTGRKNAASPTLNSQTFATSPEREPVIASEADSSATGEKSSSKSTAKKPAGNSAVFSPSEAAKENSASNSAEEKSGSSVLSVPGRKDTLVQIAQIRATAWKPRLTQDRILPTRPVTAAEEETLEHLRAQALEEKNAQMPPAFQQPRMTIGITFEVQSAVGGEKDNLRWQDGAGKQPTEASIHGDRAEIAWSSDAMSRGGEYILKAGDRDLARISVDASGAPVVKATADTRAWFWIGIEPSSSEGKASIPVTNGLKFEWCSLTGDVLPRVWPRDDDWRGGSGQRLSIPLDSSTVARGNCGIAIVDRATGWALVSDIALR